MAVSDGAVKDKARSLGSSRRPHSELDDWLNSNGATSLQGAMAGREYMTAYNAASGGGGGTTTSQKGSILRPFDVIKAGEGTSRISEMSDQYKTGIETEFDLIDKTKIQDAILGQLKIESDLHTEINEGMGLTGELSKRFRESLIETTPEAAKLGYDIGNITNMMTTLSEKTGKFNLIATNTLEQSFSTARAFGMTLPQLSEAFGEFEKVGLGASDTLDRINKAGLQSMSLGLNSKKTTQDLKTNIEKLNEFGFKNGVEGLNRMVQKSAEFRMNMSETFKVAEKVMNPESAIELTANMQMLGGAIGDLNDPLKLMYMATNNVEGLQDALHGAASTLATYNVEQQRFEITGANLRRGQEMARQLGIDYKEFAKGAIAAQERILATDALLAKGFNIDDKDREFLTNLSTMKDGEMQIVIPKSLQEELGKNEIKLSELTSDQVDFLKKQKDQFDEKSTEDIAKEMLSETKLMRNSLEAVAKSFAIVGKRELYGREGEMLSETNKNLIPGLTPVLKSIQDVRNDALGLTKDNGRIQGLIKGTLDDLKTVSTVINGEIGLVKDVVGEVKDMLKKSNSTPKSTEQQKLDEENERRKERQKVKNNDNAYIFNANLKVTHLGLGNNMTIDQTEKGYLTPMSNMS